MARFSLHAVGTDRPGIVAGVTSAIAHMNWDIGDSTMTLLAGHFAMALVIDAEGISDGRAVEVALSTVAEELDLFFVVRPLGMVPAPFVAKTTLALSVSGANKPGIVAGITAVLAGAGADIFTLESRLVDGERGAGYVMNITAALPTTVERSDVEAELLRVASSLGITCTIGHEEPSDR